MYCCCFEFSSLYYCNKHHSSIQGLLSLQIRQVHRQVIHNNALYYNALCTLLVCPSIAIVSLCCVSLKYKCCSNTLFFVVLFLLYYIISYSTNCYTIFRVHIRYTRTDVYNTISFTSQINQLVHTYYRVYFIFFKWPIF